MSATVDLDHALRIARAAAEAAGDLIARYFRSGVEVELKDDASPVTRADREAEAEIRARLGHAFPDHAIYGEEEGTTGESDWLWLVDPLDGTKSFVRGNPVFSTQIALMHRGELLLGVSHAGSYGQTAWARRGGGAFVDGREICAGLTRSFAETALSTGNLKSLARGPGWARLGTLIPQLNRIRGYGDFLHYHMLAAAQIDAVLESDVNILDIAALTVIVREAGGVFTDLAGADIGLQTRSVLAAATPELHAALLAHFSSGPEATQ